MQRFDGLAKEPLRRHLYLVLDDWASGYSIRMIDLSSDCDPNDPGSETGIVAMGPSAFHFTGERLLPAAIYRFKAQHGLPMCLAAINSKILAMPRLAQTDSDSVPANLFPIFDVCVRDISFAPRPMPDPVDPIYLPVGGRLFVLAAGCFQALTPGSRSGEWEWSVLSEPPFQRKHVTSYAVHPGNGGTIFFSVEDCTSAGTFAFSTSAAGVDEWTRHDQMMPFTGRAHFDSELDAWVGLPGDPGTIGHICLCDMESAGNWQEHPALKVCKDKLFLEDDPAERPVGTTLVYMGGLSYYFFFEPGNPHFHYCHNGNYMVSIVQQG